MVGFEVGIETEGQGDENHFDPDASGDADIRGITEEGKEAKEESLEAVKFIEAPVVASTEKRAINQRRGPDDEEAEEEDIGGFLEGEVACIANKWDEEEE